MAFTVSDLTDYVHENEKNIISSALFGGKTIGMINQMVGIKSSEEITTLDTDAAFQADTGCSYNTSGTTTFSNRALTVSKIMVSETFCPEDLEAKFLQRLVQPGGQHDKLPLEKEIMDRKVAKVQENLEKAMWMGNTSHTWSTNLKQFNGLLQIIKAASASTIAATTQSDVTTSTIRGIVEDIYSKIPAALLGQTGDKQPVLFMGWDNFRILVTKLTTDNLYHYTADNAAKTGEITYPGNGLKIVAVHGLDSNGDTNLPAAYVDNMICTYPMNLYFGTDMANEYEKMDVWYSKDDRNIKSILTFKAGCQVAFPEHIVVYKNS
jgi:hypothetical protein